MEYQKIINLLDNKPKPPWVKINDDAYGIYNPNHQFTFKTKM